MENLDNGNSNSTPYDKTYKGEMLKIEKMTAVREAEIITHLAKNGRQPLTGTFIDNFIDVGCPCRQCMRDEFL